MVNQNQNQNQNQTNSQFDPNTLSPEAMAWVDRQRTQASQTARANARRDLMHDESFLAEVRNGMMPQVQQQANDSYGERISNLEASLRNANIRAAQSEVRSILSPLGLPEQAMSTYVNLFATEDMTNSVEQANGFVTAFNNSLQNKMTQQTQQAMNTMPTPSQSATSMSEATLLQQQYDNLRKTPDNPMKAAQMSSLIRMAASKGVTLM